MLFLGDIHGAYEFIPKNRGPIVQVGDLGVGSWTLPKFNDDFRFIRGNHDNPQLCREHPNYIGDWKLEGNVLYISGAWSIDKIWRTPDVNWWADEELNFMQMHEILSLPEDAVHFVVAHDCPAFLYSHLGINGIIKENTPLFLNEVAKRFVPRKWVCGHHHQSAQLNDIGGIDFTVLGIGEVKKVNFDDEKENECWF